LLRILGVGFGIAVIVGETIGSGILRTPGDVAAHLGSPGFILAAWIIGGVYAFLCTLAVTELGTMLPLAGGWYVYSRRAFGEYGGFVAGGSDFIVQAASSAYLAVAFGEFAAELQPAFRGHVKLVAVVGVSFLMLLNWIGLRTGSRTQQITSLTKALALIAFVVACFFRSPSLTPSHAAAPDSFLALPPGGLLLALVVALQSVVVTYDGWYGAIYFTEEDENPSKNLPRSSIAGVLLCGAIFLLVNVALLHVLPMNRLAGSQMPAADAARAIFGGRGRDFILIVSLIAAISTINANLMVGPRILFAMGRDGLMPRWITSINSGGTPSAALFLSSAVTIVLVLSGSFEALVAITAILFVAVYLSGFVSLFVLRAREPELPRPFKMWGYPWTNLAICLASVAFLVASIVADPRHALFTLVVVALSYPVYFAVTQLRRSPEADLASTPVGS
jgi:APA family basic amino acid/polyamine antiporter